MLENQSLAEPAPDALLLMTSVCPYCPAALQSLATLLKEGAIGRLQVINVAIHTDEAETRRVKSVPWIQIGPFEVEGIVSVAKLRALAQGVSDAAVFDAWLFDTLAAGQRQKFEALVRREPERIHALARLMRHPQASIAIRLGIGAILEELQGSGLTDALIPTLGAMLKIDDPLLRADACHFLTLIGGEDIRPFMQACANDADAEVRETAQTWLAANPAV